MPFVVVRLACGHPSGQGQNRLGTVQRLQLTLFIYTQEREQEMARNRAQRPYVDSGYLNDGQFGRKAKALCFGKDFLILRADVDSFHDGAYGK